jgi:site-specific recombinase XerD
MKYEDIPQQAADFLNYSQTIQGKSENTVKEYYYDIRFFLRYLESVGIQDEKEVTLSDLYTYMAYLTNERKQNNATRCRKVVSLRAYYKYLHKKAKVITVDPTLELEKPKRKKSMPKYLNIEESQHLLKTVEGKHETRDYAIITLFLNCGLRLSELTGIDIGKIKGDIMTIVGKGNKERVIYLNDACLRAINDYMRYRPNGKAKDRDALFLSERNTRISKNMVQYLVKKYLAAAGLDKCYSTHKLRHTAATLMYKHGGVDVLALKEILGHENVNTTQIYTHVDSDQLKDAVTRNPLANIRKAQ